MTDESDREAKLERLVNDVVELIEADWDRQGLEEWERERLVLAFGQAVDRIKRRLG